MQIDVGMNRRYDEWLIAITLVVVVLFLFVVKPFISVDAQQSRIENLSYTTLSADSGSVPDSNWEAIANPVNLGMDSDTHHFRFSISDLQAYPEGMLLEVAYPLIDHISVRYVMPEADNPVSELSGGDALPFSEWTIQHPSMLFPVPDGHNELTVYLEVSTSGVLRLPLRLWHKTEFIEYTSLLSHLLGCFYGFLLAIGATNFFLFLTTRSTPFLLYTCYVVSLSLTLAALNGQAFAYLWPNWEWFEQRAVAIFANAAIMFAILFSRLLMNVKDYSRWMDRALKIMSGLFGLNIFISLILPYTYLIKVFLVMLAIVVSFIFVVGIMLARRGNIIARYYSFAWGILLVSGFSASLDNLGVFSAPVTSNYLLMLGALVETLLLTFVVAISYRIQREQTYQSQQSLLEQQKLSAQAQEDLVSIQQQYADELEYKVQERTLELEIALRELSEANQELERLNSIDSLTGIRNRRQFDKRLIAEGRRSRREQTVLSLAMIDIDHFKAINDRHGHAAGDACICHVANLLQSALRRSSDDVCRYGGEEFGIILPNTDSEGARQVLENMRTLVAEKPVYVEGVAIPMTVSAGVASAVIEREAQELELLKYADDLLYQAKENGRNQVVAESFIGEQS